MSKKKIVTGVLKGKDQLRVRPAVMLGSADLRAAQHTFTEIFGNALDEAASGYGTKIEVELKTDYSMRVRDFGRGVPLGWNEEHNEYEFKLIFEQLYAGSKYGDNLEVLDSITPEVLKTFRFEDYENLSSVGMNGLGATSTQYTSDWMTVRSINDEGVCSTMEYRDGESIWKEPKITQVDEPSGSDVSWKPADSVFSNDTKIPTSWVRRQAQNISVVAGLDVIFTGPDGVVENFDATTLEDYLREEVGESVYSREIYMAVEPKIKKKVITETKVAVGPASGSNFEMRYYQNYVEVKRGVHEEALASAFAAFFMSAARDKGVKLKEDDFNGMLTGVVSTRSTHVGFANQTKDSVDSQYIYDGIYRTVINLLNREKSKGTPWLAELADRVVEIAENRMAAEEIRKRVNKISKEISTRRTLPEKFVSCSNYDKKNYADTEIWIAEGDSALGGIKLARDAKSQALFPIKGKSLNLYRASLDKLLGNKEILAIMQILGTGIDLGEGVKHDRAQFDIKKLRAGKIIFASDADKDGYHIRMLLTVMFWRLFPELIEGGYVYIAESPIIGIKKGRVYSQFFYTNQEFDAHVAEHGDGFNGSTIVRFKGLGQMNAPELAETTVLPGKRRLVQVKFDPNDQEVLDTLLVLFGSNTDGRKKAILSNMMENDATFEEVIRELNAMQHEASITEIEDVREVELVTL